MPQVQVVESEVEMIWVPSDWSGPIVAAPFDNDVLNRR